MKNQTGRVRFAQAIMAKLFGKRGPVGVIDVLASVMSADQLARLVQQTTDRRHLLESAAEELAIPEEALLFEVARQAGLTITGRVLPMDIDFLPAGLTMNSFRDLGAIAITGSGTVTGIICADPSLITGLLSHLPGQPITLSTWRAIARALDESERFFLAREERRAAERRDQERAQAEKLVGLLLNQADSYRASRLEITFSERVTYGFATPEGRSARGDINPSVAEALHTLLQERHGSEGQTISVGANREIRELSYRYIPASRSAVMEWLRQEPPAILDADEPRQSQIGGPAAASPEVIQPSGGRVLQFPTGAVATLADDTAEARVMVVDDNPAFRKVLERYLGRARMQVLPVDDAKRALEMLLDEGQEKPDLVVCDLHMPGMNGQEFLTRVRTRWSGEELPIIMLTSDIDIEVELKLLELGADAFIGKNEDPRLLSVQARRLLDRQLRRKVA